MFGDVCEPQLVGGCRGEVSAHQIVMGRRARLRALGPLGFAEARPPAVVPADPPHHAIGDVVIAEADLIGEEPVPELAIVTMGIEDRIRQPGLIELGVAERRRGPPVVGGASQFEYPTRHHHGDPVSSELGHERVHQPFGSDA